MSHFAADNNIGLLVQRKAQVFMNILYQSYLFATYGLRK